MKKSIIISIIMLIVILTNTFSYATTEIPIETLEESLRKIFSSKIEIEAKLENGEINTLTMDAIQINLGENKIVITEEIPNEFEPISYEIEGNICRFSHKYENLADEDSDLLEGVYDGLFKMRLQEGLITKCYLAAADAIGIDLGLAYTYYGQKTLKMHDATEGNGTSIVEEVFKLETMKSETENKAYLEINLEKMAELDKSDLDPSSSCTVTLLDATGNEQQKCEHSYAIQKNNEQHWKQCEKCNEQESGTLENHQLGNYTDNGDGTESASCSSCGYKMTRETEKNPTTADDNIPKAGLEDGSVMIIAAVAISVGLLIKTNKYKKIKY